MVKSGIVKIKLPRTEQMADGFVGLFSSKAASFTIDEPTQIVINLGTWGNPVEGTVEPKKDMN